MSPPRSRYARTVITLPSDGSVPIPEVSTLTTRTFGQAARTGSFQAARPFATVRSAVTARENTDAGP